MNKTAWKIGEIAEKTGVTIRTLHYYHDIELLVPSGMNDVGHRVYSENDIFRLQQIISLKQFGFKLDKIKEILQRKNFEPLEIIQHQLQAIEDKQKLLIKQKSQLETILTILHKNEAKIDEFFKLIGVIDMEKILLEIGIKIIPIVDKEKGSGLIEKINDLRKKFDFPLIRIKDNLMLEETEYRILINGKEVFRDQFNSISELPDENSGIILQNLRREIEKHIEELN